GWAAGVGRVRSGAWGGGPGRDHRGGRAERAHAAAERVEPPGGSGSDDGREPDADWVVMHRRRVLEFAKAQVRARSHPRTWACFEEHLLRGRTRADRAAQLAP